MLMEWHSTTIKRVCRSTLQAETISLLHCAEEAEHLRIVFHGLWHKHDQRDRKWLVTAQDMISANWYTDCKSLEQHVNQAGTHVVTDKRLAIDLCGLRQQVWRQGGEEVGDPLLTDFLPENRTTKLTWIPTEKMPADCLTKAMKPGALSLIMNGQENDFTSKEHGCETSDGNEHGNGMKTQSFLVPT